MKKHLAVFSMGLVALVLGASLAAAQDPVVGASDPEALFTSSDAKLHKNKQAAMHIVRDLLEAGRWSEAPNWLTERYIQHNPCCANGRQTVMNFFGGRGGAERAVPDKNSWRTKVAAVVAEGDYVTVAIVRECSNPTSGQNYTTTWFDMWRFVDGKADEHWDYGTIAGQGNAADCVAAGGGARGGAGAGAAPGGGRGGPGGGAGAAPGGGRGPGAGGPGGGGRGPGAGGPPAGGE